jgi:16S rRNA (cytidine1402-2'-O)-methyltransferase
MNDAGNSNKPGVLYVVATPIGNREDITLRALATLQKVDIVAAEDTRKTRRLLAHHSIKKQLISCHEHNEERRTPQLVHKILAGTSIALVSTAGTPTVSDPGYRLIQAALENDIRVVPIPGVCAATAALSVSGLPTDSFVFTGFLSRKSEKRKQQLGALADESRTIIFYESPKRITSLLEEIQLTFGDRPAILAREITKLHEEFIRASVSDIRVRLRGRDSIKGECTLLVSGRSSQPPVDWKTVRAELLRALGQKKMKMSEASKQIARKYGIPRQKVYEEALIVSGRKTPPANRPVS